MAESSKYFDEFMKQREEASDAFVNGNSNPLDKISAQSSPATIFGPKGDCVQGAKHVNAANTKGAKLFKSGATMLLRCYTRRRMTTSHTGLAFSALSCRYKVRSKVFLWT